MVRFSGPGSPARHRHDGQGARKRDAGRSLLGPGRGGGGVRPGRSRFHVRGPAPGLVGREGDPGRDGGRRRVRPGPTSRGKARRRAGLAARRARRAWGGAPAGGPAGRRRRQGGGGASPRRGAAREPDQAGLGSIGTAAPRLGPRDRPSPGDPRPGAGRGGFAGARPMRVTKHQRQHRITKILETRPVTNQSQLVELLASEGVEATQTTVSRDLEELGAVKVRLPGGESAYALAELPIQQIVPSEQLRRVLGEWVVEMTPSGNLIVLRTPPGCAHVVASALVRSGLGGLLGTVAGDDPVLVVVAEEQGAPAMIERLQSLIEPSRGSGSPAMTDR